MEPESSAQEFPPKWNEPAKVDETPKLGIFSRLSAWIRKLHSQAVIERKRYRQEGLYTVSDTMPEDKETIATSDLPVLWIIATPGIPISEIAVRLCESYGWYLMCIGSILQRELSLETGFEDEVHHLLHRGVAVPRPVIFELIRTQMANICRRKKFNGFLFIEYPSTLTQVNEMKKFVCKPDFILFIKLSEKMTQENLYIYLKFQVRASKVLCRLKPDINVVAMEQSKKFIREVDKIYRKHHEIFKIIDASLSIEEMCREMMKWIERATVIHSRTPPLFVPPPLSEVSGE